MMMDIRKRATRFSLGQMADLEVLRITSVGAYLDGGTADILLPTKYIPQGIQEGNVISVFVYHDNDGRLIATTLKPLITVGRVAMLRAASITAHGAFMQWGIHRDLFIPYAEQESVIETDKEYAVYAYIDDLSGKITGSTKLTKHIGNTPPSYTPGQEVQILVHQRADIGYRVVVDHLHWGMIYHTDIEASKSTTDQLQYGDERIAYVVRIREDGKIDLSLSPIGYERIEPEALKLIELIQQNGGSLPIGDKSSPQEILRLAGISKKTFKMVAGHLYKQRIVLIGPASITLQNNHSDHSI